MFGWLRRTEKPDTPAHVQPAVRADAVLRRLEWKVIRRLDGLLQGDYRTLFRGAGLDLADLREYQHHDDVRYIDWNVTARLQTPYVREYHEDRELNAWFLLDLSRSVDFGSGKRDKRAVSAEFVAVLARLLTRRGNRVGAVLFGDRVDAVIPARGGRRHVLHLLHRMLQPGSTGNRNTQLRELLLGARGAMKRRSLVFIVSDFISDPGWVEPLAQLALRHDIIAVRLADPLDRDLPELGVLPLQDPETGEQIFVDTHDKGFRRRFAALAAQSTCSNWPPTTTSSRQCCASPKCASGGAGGWRVEQNRWCRRT
jgi:uncharacterized protein (DUF58 family)